MSENEEPSIKVTDKRMFAPDGTLREEYRFLEEEAKEEAKAEAERRPEERPSEATDEPSRPEAPGAASEPTILSPGGPPPGEGPGAGPGAGPGEGPAPGPGPGDEEEPDWPPSDAAGGRKPRFLDLVAALAEPASVYLRNALESPGEASQSLEVARLYIDLLDVLRQKTEGNLTPQESSMLEDALGQLRLGYVQTRG